MDFKDFTEKELLAAILNITAENNSQLESLRNRIENVEKMAMNIESEIIDSNRDVVIKPRIDEIFDEIRDEAELHISNRKSEIIQETLQLVSRNCQCVKQDV